MMKKRQQFEQLLFKIVILDAVAAVTPQGESFEAASSGRAADAKIDASRIQRVKHAKIFRDFEGTVMRQQHPARPDTNAGSFRAKPGDKDLRRRTGKGHDGMMFGNPIPFVAEFVGQASQLDCIAQGIRRSKPVGHW